MIKPFRFKKFTISQSRSVFMVGTDAVLLGALTQGSDNCTEILEVGTGTGVVSLMLAQRYFSARITAVEIDSEAFNLAQKNFTQSQFSPQLRVLNKDVRSYRTDKKYDLVVCNPPYFEVNSSEKHPVARQQISLNYNELIISAGHLVREGGILAVIIPYTTSQEFISLAAEQGFWLKRHVRIRGRDELPYRRSLLEFCFLQEVQLELQEDFTIEAAPRRFSEQYLELTNDFHVFPTI